MMMKRYTVAVIVLLTIIAISAPVLSADHFFDRKLARAEIFAKSDLQQLVLEGYIIDRVEGNAVYLYLNENELADARLLGYEVEFIPDPARQYFLELSERTAGTDNELDEYRTYDEMTTLLQSIADANPSICNLVSAGQSVQGRELWVMEISDNVAVEEDEPEFIYISTMHGDEVVGKENCLELIGYFIDNYPDDPQVQQLVDNTYIYIMPLMNPDGMTAGSRFNANGDDLNRSFPDRIDDPYNIAAGRPDEVRDVMDFFNTRSPVMAANFHGGTLVVNYPFDGNPQRQSVYTISPDDDWFIDVSLAYSIYNQPMYNGPFPRGITNGADWYDIYGGMQDWSYTWEGCPHVTIEVSTVKWPPENQLPGFWDDNRESMLSYMEMVHRGVRGIITDAETGEPLDAVVTVDDNPIEAYTDPDVGDYYRLLLPGTYSLHYYAYGYNPETVDNVTVSEGQLTRIDMALQPAGPGYVSETFDAGGGGYTHSAITPGFGDQWHLSDSRAYSPDYSWKCGAAGAGDYANNLDAGLVSSVVDLQPNSELSFWHYLDSEVSGTYYPYAYDGALVEIRPVGGNDWTAITPEDGYPFMVRNVSGNGAIPHDTPVFAGHINGREARFDLSEYTGEVQFRFRFFSDGSVSREGWYIDDVRLYSGGGGETLAITLAPQNPPVQVPAGGGNIYFDAEIVNNTPDNVQFDAWTEVILPNGNPYGPLLLREDLHLPGNGTMTPATLHQNVPGYAPAGVYSYVASVGSYPGTVISSDSFEFTKLAGTALADAVSDWEVNGWDSEETVLSSSLQPSEFALEPACPNPFNPVTRITVALPESSGLKVCVVNTLGREVAVLADSRFAAGYHTLTFNASGLSSGVYFVRAQIPGQTAQVQKIVLMK